jgi:hypothetical protein
MNLNLNLKKSNIMSVFIFLILLFILINRKTIFNSFLGRLLVIFALVGITSYNMSAGLLFVVVVMIMNNHYISEYEGMENSTPEMDKEPTTQEILKQKISAQMETLGIPTLPKPNNIEQPSTSDVAEKERKILTGKQSNQLPVDSKQNAENAVANNPGKEGFSSYASIY